MSYMFGIHSIILFKLKSLIYYSILDFRQVWSAPRGNFHICPPVVASKVSQGWNFRSLVHLCWMSTPRSSLVWGRALPRRRRAVARFCDGSDAPLHVLSVEFELYFGDVVVVLLDGLWIACALLVGDGLAGRRGGRWRSAWCFAMPLHARFYMDDRTRYEGTYIEVVWSDVKWCEELYIDT